MSPSTSSEWNHEHTTEFGTVLSVVRVGSTERFFIGTQVAALLKRETFNMYRSMKIKRVDIQRASPEQVDFLAQVGAVKPGTHSVTLIPYQDGLYFMADAWYRQHRFEVPYMKRKSRSRMRSFLAEKPTLHRRKQHPWNVHRAIRKEDLEEEHRLSVAASKDVPVKHAPVSTYTFNEPACPDELPVRQPVSYRCDVLPEKFTLRLGAPPMECS